MMRRGYDSDDSDSDDSDVAAAIAASAHAIHSLEEATSRVEIARANTRKPEPYRAPQGGLLRKPSSVRDDTRIPSSFLRPPLISSTEDQRKEIASRKLRNSDAKADAWERAQIAKIRKRYEKINTQITAWENEKKLREKYQMERKKAELELRKSRNLKHYHIKLSRISNVADGARTQVEEKRKHKESIVKDKARKNRSTGKTPVNCFCF